MSNNSAQYLDDAAECMEQEGLDRENNARHYRAGAAALRRLEQLTQWQPIEAAPREPRCIPDGWVLVSEAAIDAVAELLWKIDYPKGGSIVKVWDDNQYHDKELYRKDACEILKPSTNLPTVAEIRNAALDEAALNLNNLAPELHGSCVNNRANLRPQQFAVVECQHNEAAAPVDGVIL